MLEKKRTNLANLNITSVCVCGADSTVYSTEEISYVESPSSSKRQE